MAKRDINGTFYVASTISGDHRVPGWMELRYLQAICPQLVNKVPDAFPSVTFLFEWHAAQAGPPQIEILANIMALKRDEAHTIGGGPDIAGDGRRDAVIQNRQYACLHAGEGKRDVVTYQHMYKSLFKQVLRRSSMM